MKRQQAHIQTRVLVAGALAALIFILSGCAGPSDTRVVQKAPVVRPEVKKPQPETSRPATIQPALNTISSRIRSYEVRLEEIKAIENSPSSMMIPQEQMGRLGACKSELLDILTNYDALQKRLLQETDLDTAQRLASDTLLQVNQQDMQFLEGGCGRLLADLKGGQGMGAPPPSGAAQHPGAPPTYGAPDPQIQEAFAAGDYARVISLYNQQWTATGQQAAPTTTYQYSQALLKNYQFEEAELVLANLNTQLRQQGGIAPRPDVLRSLGDIAFSAGRYQDAQQRYEELVRLPGNQGDSWTSRQLSVLQLQMAAADELSAYATLVRNYLAYTPSRDGYAVTGQAEEFLSRYPASRLVANVNAIHKSTKEEADAWLNRGVQRIEQQVGQQPQSDAADTTPAAPPDIESTAPPVSAETEAQSTAPQAALSPEQLAARDQALQEQYDRGVAQMAAKEYDQALQTFATLLGTNFDANARERINDTASLAGEDNRQKAAELFVRASQTQDLETRKKLLLASRQLLLDVPVKYPQAGLNSKVERNLASVERALQAIDSSLLKASSGAGGGTSSNLP
jgi:tetratricopeptide (TPR) repeat protein